MEHFEPFVKFCGRCGTSPCQCGSTAGGIPFVIPEFKGPPLVVVVTDGIITSMFQERRRLNGSGERRQSDRRKA